MDKVIEINNVVNSFVWTDVGLYLLLAVGVVMTCVTGFFQVTHLAHWWKTTIGSVFKKDSSSNAKTDKKSISQFQALCTALAATVGTGNIAGVSAAICIGGPGAVLWMWIAAFLGMMTNFSENVLGIYFRRKNADGEWSGGAMYYLKDGMGKIKGLKHVASVLAVLFAFFAILASFGIGNMGQVNKIVLNLNSSFFSNVKAEIFGFPAVNLIIGIALVILGGLIILGGLQRIASFAEFVIPFMAIAYVVFGLVIIGINYENIIPAFKSIFKFAFGVEAVAGGAAGIAIKKVITQGFKRGVFSNEAGLGSSVMVHSSSNVKEPVKQGMWGIFEVFFDTMVICTITALIALTSGFINLETGHVLEGVNDATLINKAFGNVFGVFGEGFIAIAMLFFAFTTVLGWSQYGTKAVEYLFGVKVAKVYKVIFVLMIVSGALMESSVAWDISDTFNGLMMIPNLIAVVILSPLVFKITKNYLSRKLKGKDVAPMYSFDEEIQKLAEQSPSEDIIVLEEKSDK
ncbi:MAG: sodium:alanine symporter family protein [Ruminococcaceae bacterium]|nr:sodium:alanine symporter family protein [Oscillospiraceae bacterium]